jgi:hypothetical protein
MLNRPVAYLIFIGSILEERDLVSDFGDIYRDYQRKVPMLIPRHFHPIQYGPSGCDLPEGQCTR